MKRTLVRIGVALTAALVFSALAARAESLYTCGEGTVRKVETVTQTVVTQQVRPDADIFVEAPLPIETTTEEVPVGYLVTIQLNDTRYTAQSSPDVPWNFDPTTLVVDAPIAVCANDTQMVLDRYDGTDYHGRIIGVETVSR